MPTVILVDVSLSMSRYVNTEEVKPSTFLDLARDSLTNFVDRLSHETRIENIALVVFSSLHEVLVKFTKTSDDLKRALRSIISYDKTVLETAFRRVESIVMEEWGNFLPIELILVTDGQNGVGEGSLIESLSDDKTTKKYPIPFSFPCYLNIICLSSDPKDKIPFESLIDLNYKKGDLYIPETLSLPALNKCFNRLLSMRYGKYKTFLKCGYFESNVTLIPPPCFLNSYMNITNLYRQPKDLINISKLKLDTGLNIIGFLDIQDFSHPPTISRHIVLPIPRNNHTEMESKELDNSNTTSTSTTSSGGFSSIFSTNKPNDIGFQPSFCVLLHGSLKMEKMGSIVLLGDNWYGILYSYSDNKKRSSLMLSIFEPGVSVPWLGDLHKLGPASELPVNPYQVNSKENSEETPFPVPAPRQRSYRTSSNAVWIKSSGLQSDVQKILRYAKKLPDKQSAFFKEINKLRRAGVIYGFHDLLTAMASTLEKEGENTSTEVNVQLRHVAEGLRNAPNRDLSKNIIPITFRKKSSD